MTTSRIFVLRLLLLLAPIAARAQEFPVVTAEHVKAWIEGKRRMVIVDARLPEEYRQAHIKGAISIPADRISAEAARLPRDKGVPIVFYCRGLGCTLSRTAATAAAELGYTYLLVYQSGMPDWLLKGYPIETGRGARASLRR